MHHNSPAQVTSPQSLVISVDGTSPSWPGPRYSRLAKMIVDMGHGGLMIFLSINNYLDNIVSEKMR